MLNILTIQVPEQSYNNSLNKQGQHGQSWQTTSSNKGIWIWSEITTWILQVRELLLVVQGRELRNLKLLKRMPTMIYKSVVSCLNHGTLVVCLRNFSLFCSLDYRLYFFEKKNFIKMD